MCSKNGGLRVCERSVGNGKRSRNPCCPRVGGVRKMLEAIRVVGGLKVTRDCKAKGRL